MLLKELFINEDVNETKDLMAVAYYVARWFASEEHLNNYLGTALTLRQISNASGTPIPAMQTKTVKWLMLREIPGETPEALRFAANNPRLAETGEFGAYNPPHVHAIGVNLNLIAKRGKSVASILVHELDHALVDFKSSGKAIASAPYAAPTDKDSYAAYLKHPMEVNARFSQALWDLATNYETVARSDVYNAIVTNLERHRIKSQDFENPKEYKKLISRAYKFLVDVSQIINKKEKPGFVQTIQNLIKKWIP